MKTNKSESEKGIHRVFVGSQVGFLLGVVGVCVLDPNSVLGFVSALSAMLGLSGMLMALAGKLLTIMVISLKDEEVR